MKGARIRLVLFDLDGVLVNSLSPHLRISSELSRAFNVDTAIPSAKDFREMIKAGAQVSPMESFFVAVGYPKAVAKRANARYKKLFASKYKTRLFPRTKLMLTKIASCGLKIGIVTSNTRLNTLSAIKSVKGYFCPELIFTNDGSQRLSKRVAIVRGSKKAQVPVRNCIYVGDQPNDYAAAKRAGAQFLGVSYGWGIDESADFPIARSPVEVAEYITSRVSSP